MYEFKTTEEEVLAFWQKHKIREKVNERNRQANEKNKKDKAGNKFYFLDGPPYTSGSVHIGTAWNKSMKDLVMRYKRMQGFDVYDRACYDMHGLPIEHRVQEKFKLHTKEDIIKFGVDKFIEECRKFAVENLNKMNTDFTRLGAWLDYENVYMPITEDSIEAIWWLIKKVHEQGRLYEGERSITWCANCETALAKHELEYETVTDKSIFMKFPVVGENNEFLLIWTTTPWTIPLNLGVMVNPELDYVKAEVYMDGNQENKNNYNTEIWIVAKELCNVVISAMAEKKFKILSEFKGEKLEGLKYKHPFYDSFKEDYEKYEKLCDKTFTVLLSSEYVDTSSGTGLVHVSPGCGPEDYEVGHRYGIKPFNNVDERGRYPKDFGPIGGFHTKKDTDKFIKFLEPAIFAQSDVEHEYPHCWRCHKPAIFRTTKQWFFKVEDLKANMINANNEITWVPQAGFNAFDSWLHNLRDNSITKQRFWGTPLPVWRCDLCGRFEVVVTRSEIERKAGLHAGELKHLHKPWIDAVSFPCECGSKLKKIPDVMDVWIDPGCLSWTALGYPRNKELFEKLYPADFIIEGKDQIRGWFNVLMVCSMLALQRPSFKNVYMHGFVQDALGRKMSKSLGNVISPYEVIDKYGADTFRYYAIGGANPGIDLNYNFEDMKLKHKNLMILWNLQNLLIDLANELEVNPAKLVYNIEQLDVEEKYIFSKLNSAIKNVTEKMDKYLINEAPALVEEVFLELSRTYVQMVREKSAQGNDEERKIVLYTLYNVLFETVKMFSIVCPFITEKIYRNLNDEFGLKLESVHLFSWPRFDAAKIHPKLEKNVDVVKNILQVAANAREKIQLGLKWPLGEMIIETKNDDAIEAVSELEKVLLAQGNFKKVKVVSKFDKVKLQVKVNSGKIGADFGAKAPKIIAALALVSWDNVLAKIEKDGSFSVKVDDEKVEIKKEHLHINREVAKPYQEAEFKFGYVYLNSSLDDALEAEGFAREMMRKVQALRKKAGLNKMDSISLHVKAADEDDAKMLASWQEAIAKKCGASHIKISTLGAAKKLAVVGVEKIKDKSFEVGFEKV